MGHRFSIFPILLNLSLLVCGEVLALDSILRVEGGYAERRQGIDSISISLISSCSLDSPLETLEFELGFSFFGFFFPFRDLANVHQFVVI